MLSGRGGEENIGEKIIMTKLTCRAKGTKCSPAEKDGSLWDSLVQLTVPRRMEFANSQIIKYARFGWFFKQFYWREQRRKHTVTYYIYKIKEEIMLTLSYV